jgi:hypothetical protein
LHFSDLNNEIRRERRDKEQIRQIVQVVVQQGKKCIGIPLLAKKCIPTPDQLICLCQVIKLKTTRIFLCLMNVFWKTQLLTNLKQFSANHLEMSLTMSKVSLSAKNGLVLEQGKSEVQKTILLLVTSPLVVVNHLYCREEIRKCPIQATTRIDCNTELPCWLNSEEDKMLAFQNELLE